jgi:methyltransferase-like protein 6
MANHSPPHTEDGGRKMPPQATRRPLPPPFVERYEPYADATRTNTPVGFKPFADCRANWDAYYRHNTVNGYKDRHYIVREFTELRDALDAAVICTAKRSRSESSSVASQAPTLAAEARVTMAEIGCGVGNTVLPLLADHDQLCAVACDISAVAVNLLRDQARKLGLDDTRCRAAVVDIAQERIPPGLLRHPGAPTDAVVIGTVPLASLVFVLCSVPVTRMAYAVETVAAALHPGTGVLFWRDYAEGDMAQRRFDDSNRRVVVDEDDDDAAAAAGHSKDSTTFARTNGTLSHFFTRQEVLDLFTVHFAVVELTLVERTVVNRKTGAEMRRLWWQGRFRRLPAQG